MPHKRAKRSVREQQRSQKGADLAPTQVALSNEAIPKSLARVLNAAKIREDWKDKKRKSSEDIGGKSVKKRKMDNIAGDGTKTKVKVKAEVASRNKPSLTIKPGESLAHFNRRVEDDMRPLVKTAVQTSLAVARNARKVEAEERAAKAAAKKANSKNGKTAAVDGGERAASPSPPPTAAKHADRPKEFSTHSSSAPRRLNDIAQAPPEFNKLPRGVVQNALGKNSSSGSSVLSMAQKVMMEQEREKAILRYREMKAKRRAEGGGGDERDRDGEDEEE